MLFLTNFIMNIAILQLQALAMRLPPRLRRMGAGAAVGALYACALFLCRSLRAPLGAKLIAGVVICGISFGSWKPRILLKRTLVFCLMTYAMGAFVLGILYFTDAGIRLGGMVRNGVFYFDITLGFLILCCVLAISALWMWLRKAKSAVSRNCTIVTVVRNGKKARLTALVDTGNCLKDPFSGKSVLVAETKALKELFKTGEAPQSICTHLPPGFRLIPYSSVGNACGLLAAFTPDETIVNGESRKDIAVALYGGTLCKNGDYNALIGPLDINRKDVTYA